MSEATIDPYDVMLSAVAFARACSQKDTPGAAEAWRGCSDDERLGIATALASLLADQMTDADWDRLLGAVS